MSAVDVLTESAPPRVWLQVDTSGNPHDRSETIPEDCWGELTWCYESIGGQEVEYVRADKLTAVHDALSSLVCICAESGWPKTAEHMTPLAVARAALRALDTKENERD